MGGGGRDGGPEGLVLSGIEVYVMERCSMIEFELMM